MAILTGSKIIDEIKNKHIRIGNFDIRRIQPNSYDLTLGDKISFYSLTDDATYISEYPFNETFETHGMRAIVGKVFQDSDIVRDRQLYYLDTQKDNSMITNDIPSSGYILLPRILYLVETTESVWSDKYVTEVSGVSSLARLGISVHKTAGYANIGHEFKWILEVEVTHPIKIYPGMKIGQMYFHTTDGSCDLQYHGKYSGKQMDDALCGSLNYLDSEESK